MREGIALGKIKLNIKKKGGDMNCGILLKFIVADRHQEFPFGMEEARKAHKGPRDTQVDQDWPWAQRRVKF